jgi:hypothetical protein
MDAGTKKILDDLAQSGDIRLTEDGEKFYPTSSKYAHLERLDSGPFPYFCVYLGSGSTQITEEDMEWARSVAERVL